MKICVFTQTFPRYQDDPVAPFMRDLCQGLVKAGNKVIVLAPYDSKFSLRKGKLDFKIKLYKYVFADRLHLLGYSRTLIGDQRFKFFVYPLAPLMFLFSFLALLRLVYREKIDLISAHWIIPNGFIAALVSRITKTPLVISLPGSDIFLAKKNPVFRRMAQFAAHQAKALVSNSHQYLKDYAQFTPNLPQRVEIPYGIKIEKSPISAPEKMKLRKKYGFSKKDLIILGVGRLVEKKGFSYLIKSLGLLLQKKPQSKLIIIGDGVLKKPLQNLAEELNIREIVFFPGQVKHDQLSDYYHLADVFVMPSINDSQGHLESHPVALFEAMAAGLPVVASKLAVNFQYVINGQNGYRIRQKSSQAISKKVLKILNSRHRRKMGQKSRLIAKNNLTFETSGVKYSQLFQAIIKGN